MAPLYRLVLLGLAGLRLVAGNALQTCQTLAATVSSQSTVIYPWTDATAFASDTRHWMLSSSQRPTCVLEVGSVQDVSLAMTVISADRSPFAVMCGGHASNPGFSSTEGVHISLRRLQGVTLSADLTTVELGFGLRWADVYDRLEGTGVNVVGGRVPGPGVGGLTLGGGYSWKTNQYGLACDTVKTFHLVLPNGTITQASSDYNPDLFFALKGGLNRFGIVTSAEFRTHKQPNLILGGLALYRDTAAVVRATAQFAANNTDPRTQIITTLGSTPGGAVALVLFFHDGPERPAGLAPFDELGAFGRPDQQVSNVRQQTFSRFVKGIPASLASPANIRAAFSTMSTTALPLEFLQAVEDETEALGKLMLTHGGTVVSYDIEPFSAYGKHATDSAFPHGDSPLPLNVYFAWAQESQDAFWHTAMADSVARLGAVAARLGIAGAKRDRAKYARYPNYAHSAHSAAQLYGTANAARLVEIRNRIDPARVMDLTGGFNIM